MHIEVTCLPFSLHFLLIFGWLFLFIASLHHYIDFALLVLSHTHTLTLGVMSRQSVSIETWEEIRFATITVVCISSCDYCWPPIEHSINLSHCANRAKRDSWFAITLYHVCVCVLKYINLSNNTWLGSYFSLLSIRVIRYLLAKTSFQRNSATASGDENKNEKNTLSHR